jgi:hypothetical protein
MSKVFSEEFGYLEIKGIDEEGKYLCKGVKGN